jgi:CelD/BcsL family acetyltransferase involved in cellulose biosynthesis
MQVQQVENADEFDRLRGEWNALLEESAANGVFLTFEWLRTWWKHLAGGRKLSMVALRNDSNDGNDGNNLVGLAPLAIRPAGLQRLFPFRCSEFLGSGTAGSDYLDLIVQKTSEDEVVEALVKYFSSTNRMLEFGQLKAGSLAARLARSLERRGWRSTTTPVGTCPKIDLRGHTWTSYLANLTSEHRYNVRRKTNALSKNFAVTFERVETEAQRGPALRALIDLHRKRWLEHGASDAFHTAGHLAFHEEFTRLALERGWLRLDILRLNGQPASAIYALRYGPSFSFYQSGFDPQYGKYSVGLVAMAMSIQSAIAEGAEEYDFLHGTEAYKFHWAAGSRDLERIQLHPPGLIGWCQQTVLGGRTRARDWFRSSSLKPNVGPVAR